MGKIGLTQFRNVAEKPICRLIQDILASIDQTIETPLPAYHRWASEVE